MRLWYIFHLQCAPFASIWQQTRADRAQFLHNFIIYMVFFFSLSLCFLRLSFLRSNVIYIILCGIYAYANNVYFIAFNITFRNYWINLLLFVYGLCWNCMLLHIFLLKNCLPAKCFEWMDAHWNGIKRRWEWNLHRHTHTHCTLRTGENEIQIKYNVNSFVSILLRIKCLSYTNGNRTLNNGKFKDAYVLYMQ